MKATARHRVAKFSQTEMFPTLFHKNYIVKGHTMRVDKNGKLVWESSDIIWSVKKDGTSEPS